MCEFELILASGSRYRKELLSRFKLEFKAVSPDVDEEFFKQSITEPVALAETLALKKALAVALRFPHAVVIGSDQLVSMDNLILGKPHTKENAVAQLQAMQDKSHQLITAICVLSPVKTVSYTDITTLKMRSLSIEEINRYVVQDNPIDCAGSYKIESSGIGLFDKIETTDFTAITGLPLIQVASILRSLGFSIP